MNEVRLTVKSVSGNVECGCGQDIKVSADSGTKTQKAKKCKSCGAVIMPRVNANQVLFYYSEMPKPEETDEDE